MADFVQIEWITGRPQTGADEDEARAIAAAEAVFQREGVLPADAEADYREQWERLDDEEPMTGAARVWIAARDAANLAATEGWHNPDGGSVTINCYRV